LPKRKNETTKYKVGVCVLPSVPKFTPQIPDSSIFEKGEKFREWLLYKSKKKKFFRIFFAFFSHFFRYFFNFFFFSLLVVNGERAAMHAIDFRGKLKNTNKTYLSRMINDFTKK
jgi:hypothetical protein